MGGRWDVMRVALLLLLSIDPSLAAVNGAFAMGSVSGSSINETLAPNSTRVPSTHFRDPLLKMCEKSERITLADVQAAAPVVFLRMVQEPFWRDLMMNKEADLLSTISSVVKSLTQDEAFSENRNCENRILRDVFPDLHAQFSDSSEQINTTQDVASIMNTLTKDAVALAVGSPFDSARTFNKLQDHILTKDASAESSMKKIDAMKSVQSLVDTTQELLQTTISTSPTSDMTTVYNGQPLPPNNGEILSRTLDYASINYDDFVRQALTVVKVNSGIILALCVLTAGHEMLDLLGRDTDGDFLMREQLRTGKHQIIDTSMIERSPEVGAKSLTMGSAALDAMLYGANSPLVNRVPLPGQDNASQLRISMLKGNDKILYQSLNAEGRKKFKSLFGHMPAVGVHEADILGPIERPIVDSDKRTGYYTSSPETIAADNVKKALFGSVESGLETHIDDRVIAATQKDIGGFVGSLRIKVLRMALDARTGNGDSSSRRLKMEAMKSTNRLVSVEDIVALLYYIQEGLELDSSRKVNAVIDTVMGQIQENVQTVCYYGGGKASQILMKWVKAMSLEDATGDVEGCPQLLAPDEDEPSQVFIKLADVNSLPVVQAVSSIIDTTMGLTPGQQIQLSQINTASRIDNLFTSSNSMARVNFALMVASALKESWTTAGRLYDMSKVPCTTRDPDELTLFWNVPMPGPACPTYGIAYFPKWVEWLASNGGRLQIFASDPIGNTVEYQCMTGVQPDPEVRRLNPDNEPGSVRLSGHIPACVQDPSAYECFYRDTEFNTRTCLASQSNGGDILPGALKWSSPSANTKETTFKASVRFSSHYGETDDGFLCSPSTTVSLASATYNVYRLGSTCNAGEARCVGRPLDSSCKELCNSEANCQAFFSTPAPNNEVGSYCYTFPGALFPMQPSSNKKDVVCYKDLGVRFLFFDTTNTPLVELRLQRSGYQIWSGSTMVDNIAFATKDFITSEKYRYLNFHLKQNTDSVTNLKDVELVMSTMYRLTNSVPAEDNFKWLKGQSITIPLLQDQTSTDELLIVELGSGCYERGQIRDLCYMSDTLPDAFLYPSMGFDEVHSENYALTVSNSRSFTAPSASNLLQVNADSETQHITATSETNKSGNSQVPSSPSVLTPSLPAAESSSASGKGEGVWAKIEMSVWGEDGKSGIAGMVKEKIASVHLPDFDFSKTLSELVKGPSEWKTAMSDVQSLMSFDHAEDLLLASMLQAAPFKAAAHLFGVEGQVDKFASTLKKSLETVHDFSAADGAKALYSSIANKISGKHSAQLETQTLLQGVTLPDPTSMQGPVRGAGTLLISYIIGTVIAVVYQLIKFQDRVNPENNITIGNTVVMFNPAAAIIPMGTYYKQNGPVAQGNILALLFIVISSTIGLFRLMRYTAIEGSKANDLLYSARD